MMKNMDCPFKQISFYSVNLNKTLFYLSQMLPTHELNEFISYSDATQLQYFIVKVCKIRDPRKEYCIQIKKGNM